MNSAAEEVQYARIDGISADVTDGTEDGRLVFNTAVAGSANTMTMSLTGGNVGIGVTNPTARLQVSGGSANTEHVVISGYSNPNRGLSISTQKSNYPTDSGNHDSAVVYNAQDTESSSIYGQHIFQTGGTTRMQIDSVGVGIGIATPINALSVSGVITSGNFTAAGIGGTPGDANTAEVGPGYLILARDDTADAAQIKFGKNGAVHSYLETRTNGLGFITNVGNFGFEGGNVGIGVANPGYELQVTDSTSSNNKVIAAFTGEGVSSGTTTGGQYVAIVRGGAISSGSNAAAGGLLLGISASPTGSNCGIRGTYEYNNGRDLQLFTSADNSSAPTNKMIIKGDGKVGIGTDSPSSTKLTIRGDNSIPAGIRLEDDGGALCQLHYSEGSGFFLRIPNAANDESVMIRSYGDTVFNGGDVGIGVTNPHKKLQIKEGTSSTGVHYALSVGGSNHVAGYAAGIGIDPEGYGNRNKIAIVAEGRNQGYSRGKLHFLLDATSDSGEATLSESRMVIQEDGKVGIGTVSPAEALEVVGKIYVANHPIQAGTALMGGDLSFNNVDGETGSTGSQSFAYFGTNNSSKGMVFSRDSNAGYHDMFITSNGYVKVGNLTTKNDHLHLRATEGYTGIGRHIICSDWKNWSGTGNYTARLYTPILKGESNMFTIKIWVYGYSTGGYNQEYSFSGYAYSGNNSLIASSAQATNSNSSLSVAIGSGVVPSGFNMAGSDVVHCDVGTANNGTSYYNHMRWEYWGWGNKEGTDFQWGHVTT